MHRAGIRLIFQILFGCFANVVNNTIKIKKCFSQLLENVFCLSCHEIEQRHRWISSKPNIFSMGGLRIEAALTSTAPHCSPAVQHWSLCVFWCTGPECDVISLLRQRRQARSPPPGHRPLTWTRALYVIITERLSQTSSVAYGKFKLSGEKV